jgi:hypothetical protein
VVSGPLGPRPPGVPCGGWHVRSAGRLECEDRSLAARIRLLDTAANTRSCRIAGVAEAHTHTVLSIFHRSLMAAMIADSTALFPYQDKPNAESALGDDCMVASPRPSRSANYGAAIAEIIPAARTRHVIDPKPTSTTFILSAGTPDGVCEIPAVRPAGGRGRTPPRRRPGRQGSAAVRALSPFRAFDAGLRPGPFPDKAASLLPGLLAATRTGLPPAGDDELTNAKTHHGVTSRRHLQFCSAHE